MVFYLRKRVNILRKCVKYGFICFLRGDRASSARRQANSKVSHAGRKERCRGLTLLGRLTQRVHSKAFFVFFTKAGGIFVAYR